MQNYVRYSIIFRLSFLVLVSSFLVGVNNNGNIYALQQKGPHLNFSFSVTGDWGCGLNAIDTVDGIVEKEPQLVISTGDLSYAKTANCWLDAISSLEKNGKIRIAFGDHDLDNNLTKYYQYTNHFTLNKPYYSFNYGNVHFLAMATGRDGIIPYGGNSAQYRFVIQDLANAHNNKTIGWIIVYGYMPFYSSPTKHPGDTKVHRIYHPLLDKYGVDLVIQGHNHNYQRTYPLIYNTINDSSPIVTSTSTRQYNHDPKGPIFITVGTAGQNLYNFTGKAPYIITQFLRHGFLNVNITDNGSMLEAAFIEDGSGKVSDRFSILKNNR
jgi:predicted MPP superfamily phosphohydrolase